MDGKLSKGVNKFVLLKNICLSVFEGHFLIKGRVGSAISERGVIRNTYARNKLHCHFFAKDARSKKYFFAVTNHDN